MNVAQVAAEIMKREGTDHLLAYPLNPLTESCSAVGIRPIIVRQERIGLHMADCISRQTSGDKVGVFCQQVGPGCENSFGAVAQAFSEGVPLLVMPGGYPRATSWVRPNFNATLNYQHVTKTCELLSARYPITLTDPGAAAVPRVLAAATQLIMVAPGSVSVIG